MEKLANFVGFGVALGSLLYLDVNPRVVVYAFILSTLARLLTVD